MKLTQFSQSDLPIITDEHFWIINLPKYNDPTALVLRYDGNLLKDSFKENHSHLSMGHNYFTRAERLPKGIIIKRTVVSVLPSAFWQETLLEKYLKKYKHSFYVRFRSISHNGGLLSSGGDKHKTINRLITKNYKK